MIALAGWFVRDEPRKTMLTQPGPGARLILPRSSSRLEPGRYQREPRMQSDPSGSQIKGLSFNWRGASARAGMHRKAAQMARQAARKSNSRRAKPSP